MWLANSISGNRKKKCCTYNTFDMTLFRKTISNYQDAVGLSLTVQHHPMYGHTNSANQIQSYMIILLSLLVSLFQKSTHKVSRPTMKHNCEKNSMALSISFYCMIKVNKSCGDGVVLFVSWTNWIHIATSNGGVIFTLGYQNITHMLNWFISHTFL